MNAKFRGREIRGMNMSTTSLYLASSRNVAQRPAARAVPQVSMNTTQRLARYETAQELCGMMAARRSEWIRDEELQATADLAKIEQWRRERAAYLNEGGSLLLSDVDAIERVIAVYGPLVRAGNAA
jgi:hypothetical protein